MSAAIVKLKSDANASELKQLSSLLADAIIEGYEQTPIPNIIIPIPLHWLKLLRRGFNQSQLIASILKTKLPNTLVRTDICTRKRYGKAQHLQTRHQRQRSMSDAFHSHRKLDLEGAMVALVDDVVTTGATAAAATESLLQAGVKSVDVWCIARTGWHNRASSIKISHH